MNNNYEMSIKSAVEDKVPDHYVMAVVRIDDEHGIADILGTHTFIIEKDGDVYTATCEDLRAITQGRDWTELKVKIRNMHSFLVGDKYGIQKD